MQFAASSSVKSISSVLPMLAVSLLPALLVVGMACLEMSNQEEAYRFPGVLPRPPKSREAPAISVRLSRQGGLTVAGEPIAVGAWLAAWERERAAVQLLGFQPSQAVVFVHADGEIPTDKVQAVIETLQESGFTHCVLRTAEPR
jgi:biopolymer transport protein ExbD